MPSYAMLASYAFDSTILLCIHCSYAVVSYLYVLIVYPMYHTGTWYGLAELFFKLGLQASSTEEGRTD